jgi:hypothetical protein
VFREKDLRTRTSKFKTMLGGAVDTMAQARERLEFSERELARLGREEVAQTVASVAAERQYEQELADAEQELLDKRAQKLESFRAMKAAFLAVNPNSLAAHHASGGDDAHAETARLQQQKKLWDRCLFQTRVMQQEQLCVDLEAENETLRQVIMQKEHADSFANRQGLHAANAAPSYVDIDAPPPLDGPRTIVPQSVTVPDDVALFPAPPRIDTWNGPNSSAPSLAGARGVGGVHVFIDPDTEQAEVHHSVHGFGPISPVPPVPPSVYYFDPTGPVAGGSSLNQGGGGGGGAGHPEPLTSPFTKSLGHVFSTDHTRAAHPPPNQLTVHLHRMAHDHPKLSSSIGATTPRAGRRAPVLPATIDQALGIPNAPHALMHATGQQPKRALAHSLRNAEYSSEPQQDFSASTTLPFRRAPLGDTSGGRMVGARLHSKRLWQLTQHGIGGAEQNVLQQHRGQSAPAGESQQQQRPHSRPSSSSIQMPYHQATQDELEEEAAALRADQEVEESVTFPDVSSATAAADRPQSRSSSAASSIPINFMPRPPSSDATTAHRASQRVSHAPSGTSFAASSSSSFSLPLHSGAPSPRGAALSFAMSVGGGQVMDMEAWRREVTRMAQPASGAELSGASSTRSVNNGATLNYANVNPPAATGGAATARQRSGIQAARGMQSALPVSYAGPVASSSNYPSGSVTARPTRPNRPMRPAVAAPVAAAVTVAAPSASASDRDSSRPTITRPPAPSHRAVSYQRAAQAGAELISTRTAFQVLLPPTPSIALQGAPPLRAQPFQVDVPTSSSNLSLSSGARARLLRRASILQTAAQMQLRQSHEHERFEHKFG